MNRIKITEMNNSSIFQLEEAIVRYKNVFIVGDIIKEIPNGFEINMHNISPKNGWNWTLYVNSKLDSAIIARHWLGKKIPGKTIWTLEELDMELRKIKSLLKREK